MCYFTKLDIYWGYNNVHIHEGDEWKAIFYTNRSQFKPLVMYFWPHQQSGHLPDDDE
jgi:hypothetical protein